MRPELTVREFLLLLKTEETNRKQFISYKIIHNLYHTIITHVLTFHEEKRNNLPGTSIQNIPVTKIL